MIPPDVHAGCSSHGERDIFYRLKEDPATRDWIILHSLDLAHHRKQISGEIDFVIIVPAKGVLCLEVKACSKVRRDSGNWYYGPDPKPDARGPFKQASEAMHSLRLRIAERRPELSKVVFWSAVIFPYLKFSSISEEWHPWQVIDTQAFRSRPLSQLLEAVLDHAHQHLQMCPGASWFKSELQEPDAKQCELIAETLRPDFELFESPKSQSRRREEELRRFTEEQYFALDAMESNPRVAFVGPAGTGKTVLAIEAARRGHIRGRRILFLCFNRLLGKWLEMQTTDMYPGVITRTIHGHMLSVAGTKAKDDQHFWEDELPATAADSLLEAPGEEYLFDELIIDEAQDILRDNYLDFLDLSLKGGLAAGRWRLFGDFEKQAIYGAANKPLDVFLNTRGEYAPKYNLRINCRNTPNIASLAYMLGGLNPAYSKILRPDNGIKPELIFYSDDDEQQRLLTKALDNLYAEGFLGQDIVILSTKASESCASKITVTPWKDRISHIDKAMKGQVEFCSVHAFKGLEAPVIVLTDVERISGLYEQALFYIAITRALHRLVIIMKSSAKEEVAEAVRAIAKRNMPGG